MDVTNFKDLIDKAAEMEDQSVEVQTTFDNDPPPAGPTIGRFIEYIELGKHKQGDYQGKPKPDAEVVRVTFELLHPKKNIKEYEADGKKVVTGQLVSLKITKKLGDKAKFKRLFNKMTYGRPIKHMAQMLGEGFIINVYHNVVKKDGKDTTYVNLDKEGDYGIGAPFIIDPITEARTDVPIQPATRPLKLFLWNNPTKETWASLYIEGTRERKNADGSTEQVSKNWLQEQILSATNYTGSPLADMLGGVPELPTSEPEVTKPQEQAQKPTEKPVEAKNEPPASKPAEDAATDALAALGLV
jgi:hypothetical protein